PAGLETPFVYQHTEGAQKGWVWAIRETKADEAWRIEIYWKAKEELDVLWPFEVDIYHVTWSATAQRFVRGAPGDAEPKVYFPSEILTELMPHFSPPTHQPILENGVFSSVNTGYCLLRYTADQRVWFEPVRSVERTEAPGYTNPINAEIGAELRPVDGGGQPLEAEYGEWPGYLYTNAGTVYNLGKYQYPSSYLDPATIESYVFPVNRGNLEVWWANRSRQAELPQPIFFPSRVNRYVCDWPTHPQEITIASGVGNQGYTEDRNTACIRFDRGSLSLEEAQALSCHLRLDNPNSLNIANELTLELWVKPASAVGMQYLVDKGVNFRLRLNGGVPELYVGGRWYRAAAGVTAGVWQHLAVTVADRGRVAFYRDGHDIGAASFIGSLSPQAVPLRVGAWASDGVTPEDFYTGYLDELRIWAVARTKEQIRTDLNVSVDAGSAGLRARYRFNSADRVLDTSHFGNHIELPPAGVSFAFPGVPQVLPGTDLAGVDIGLYVQNDRTRHGFNPNEEHAIIFQSVVYALRCDLNVTSGVTRTSEPYVLIDCRTPLVNNNRPYMNVFRVVPTNSFYSFSRFLTAGLMIQPPAPIALMNPSNCSSNDQVAGPEFRDRKGYYWARQAGDEGGTTNYVFDFYYPMQSDFVFPQRLVQPGAGAQIGWLDVFSGDGTPVDFTFVVEWPEDAPVLHIGD
ncbi:MAG TPA: LamG domain-containing protein, partial [candidate division Zixibacteria bacterium]|nr:LamG domain-containing protein [candidate division Zixibacteria bacterium]